MRTVGAKLRIWRLHVKANDYFSLIPHDLNYFHDHFVGEPMPATWAPPPITVSGKSKKLPDIVSWMTKAPLVSERAKDVLAPIVADGAQFLPFHDLKGKKYYAMNITRVERGILDVARSDMHRSATPPNEPLGIWAAVFDVPATYELPAVFKAGLRGGPVFSEVFVTQRFVDAAIEHRLIGFELGDPGERSLPYILDGKPQNVVPGIVG